MTNIKRIKAKHFTGSKGGKIIFTRHEQGKSYSGKWDFRSQKSRSEGVGKQSMVIGVGCFVGGQRTFWKAVCKIGTKGET